ncbi:MAG: metallophosphoesterase [Lentisphaeria bacterium]|nr:metallophosphoesterase [Lentisphaeria bacterium]
MKKICLFALLLPLCLLAAEPRLKIAAVSDVHEKWRDLERVFSFLAEKDPDVVLCGGDITNGDPAGYAKYIEIYDRCFSKKKPAPVHIPILGNHDYLAFPKGGKRPSARESMKRFFGPMGLPARWLQHHQVKGYTFIGVSATDDKGEHSDPAEIKQVSDLIGKAEKAAPGKPVFVLTHLTPAFTLARSDFAETKAPKARYHWRVDNIRRMLEIHPQAVSISGHTHLALEDERTIWQGEFTAVHAGVLRWVTPQKPAPLSGMIDTLDRFGGRNFIYIEVFDREMVVCRFDANTLCEIKPEKRWRISLPYTPEKAVYTSRRASPSAPQFPARAKARILRRGKNFYLDLDRAEHPDMVLAYKVRLFRDGAEKPQEFFVSSDYFLHDKQPKRALNIDQKIKLAPGKGTMEITPYETFGKAGKPLVTEFIIPEENRTEKK